MEEPEMGRDAAVATNCARDESDYGPESTSIASRCNDRSEVILHWQLEVVQVLLRWRCCCSATGSSRPPPVALASSPPSLPLIAPLIDRSNARKPRARPQAPPTRTPDLPNLHRQLLSSCQQNYSVFSLTSPLCSLHRTLFDSASNLLSL